MYSKRPLKLFNLHDGYLQKVGSSRVIYIDVYSIYICIFAERARGRERPAKDWKACEYLHVLRMRAAQASYRYFFATLPLSKSLFSG